MSATRVRALAVHLACRACYTRVRAVLYDDAWEEATAPLGGWWMAHRAPLLVAVDLLIDGRLCTVPATLTTKEK